MQSGRISTARTFPSSPSDAPTTWNSGVSTDRTCCRISELSSTTSTVGLSTILSTEVMSPSSPRDSFVFSNSAVSSNRFDGNSTPPPSDSPRPTRSDFDSGEVSVVARCSCARWSCPRRKRTVKVAPSPWVLSTEIMPPCSSTRSWTYASPIPVPPWAEAPEDSACANRSKILLCRSGGMPGPVSDTSISAYSVVVDTETSTLPSSGVNLIALERRFPEMRSRASGSA